MTIGIGFPFEIDSISAECNKTSSSFSLLFKHFMHLCVCVCIECISENSLLGCDHSSQLEPAIVHFLRCIFVDIIRCLLHFSLFLQICILSHFAVFLLTFAIFLITFGLILLHFFVFPHIFLHLLHFVPILLHIILGPFRRFYHISCIFFYYIPGLKKHCISFVYISD